MLLVRYRINHGVEIIDIDEDMSGYPEFSVMTNLSCPKCFSEVEIT